MRFQQHRTVNVTSYWRRRFFLFVFEHWQQWTKLVLMKGSCMYIDGKLLRDISLLKAALKHIDVC